MTQASQLSREAQKGTHLLADGSSYEGELAQGLPHGFGTQTFADENVYQEQFEKGLPHSHGIMRYKAVPKSTDTSGTGQMVCEWFWYIGNV